MPGENEVEQDIEETTQEAVGEATAGQQQEEAPERTEAPEAPAAPQANQDAQHWEKLYRESNEQNQSFRKYAESQGKSYEDFRNGMLNLMDPERAKREAKPEFYTKQEAEQYVKAQLERQTQAAREERIREDYDRELPQALKAHQPVVDAYGKDGAVELATQLWMRRPGKYPTLDSAFKAIQSGLDAHVKKNQQSWNKNKEETQRNLRSPGTKPGSPAPRGSSGANGEGGPRGIDRLRGALGRSKKGA